MHLGTFVMKENGTFEVDAEEARDAAKPARVLSEIRNAAERRPKKPRVRRITDRRRAQNRVAQRSYREKQKQRLQQLTGDNGGKHGLSGVEASITRDPSSDQPRAPEAGIDAPASSSALIGDAAEAGLLDQAPGLWDWPDSVGPIHPYQSGFAFGDSQLNSMDLFYDITSTSASAAASASASASTSASAPPAGRPGGDPYHRSIQDMASMASYHPRSLVPVTAPSNFHPPIEDDMQTPKTGNAFCHLEDQLLDNVDLHDPGFPVAAYQPNDADYDSVLFSQHFN